MQTTTYPPVPADHVAVLATGSYLPEKILSNAELEVLVETSDEWITTRTGIKERRIAAADETTSDMAAKAAQKALDQAGLQASELDAILVATVSPDMFFPSTACFVQKKIGAFQAFCMDVSAACSGFLYALEMSRNMVSAGSAAKVLVIGAEKLSALVDWTDRNTCVLFGDGAGAVILGENGGRPGMITTVLGSDGRFSEILNLPGGGVHCPITAENVGDRLNTIKMNGKETFKQAVTAMQAAAVQVLAKRGWSSDDLTLVIPHQANIRIVEAIAERMKLSMDRVFVNLQRYGNTSAASVAIALDEAARTGCLKAGDKLLLVAFGGGLTWASCTLQWSLD
ncbi:MAG: beta-ketoacyl-ACP synthase III [Verrucomicrobiales bacterium]